MKRILLASHNYSFTGAPLVLLQLAKGLKGEYEPELWSPVDGPLSLETLGVSEAEYIPTRVHPNCWPVETYDLVIANTLLSWPVVLECEAKGVPCIWWLHEGPWAKEALWSAGMAEAMALHSEYVVSSRYLVGVYGCKGHVTEISYGCPVTSPKVWGTGDRPLEFLVAGSIEWRKGQDQVLAAWSRLDLKGARLTLVGDSNNGWARELIRLYGNLWGVSFVPPMPPGNFAKLLEASDVLLVPSRDEGGYPQVLLQAQEKGLCVVAADVCGMLEQVPLETGFLTNQWDTAIRVLIQSDRRNPIQLFGEHAREWVHTNNSLEDHIQGWKKLIEEVTSHV